MPYPSQINHAQIVSIATELISLHGQEWLSLGKLASTLGVKAPSLYRYFASKNDLLREINRQTREAITLQVHEATNAAGQDAHKRAVAMAKAYRAYSIAHPHLYLMLYANLDPNIRPENPEINNILDALYNELEPLYPENPLLAMAGLRALAHGFIVNELNGQFWRSGDADADFEFAITTYIKGLTC